MRQKFLAAVTLLVIFTFIVGEYSSNTKLLTLILESVFCSLATFVVVWIETVNYKVSKSKVR